MPRINFKVIDDYLVLQFVQNILYYLYLLFFNIGSIESLILTHDVFISPSSDITKL